MNMSRISSSSSTPQLHFAAIPVSIAWNWVNVSCSCCLLEKNSTLSTMVFLSNVNTVSIWAFLSSRVPSAILTYGNCAWNLLGPSSPNIIYNTEVALFSASSRMRPPNVSEFHFFRSSSCCLSALSTALSLFASLFFFSSGVSSLPMGGRDSLTSGYSGSRSFNNVLMLMLRDF